MRLDPGNHHPPQRASSSRSPQQLAVGGRGACAAQPCRTPGAAQLLPVQQQIVAVLRQTIADGGGLGRLQVGEGHAGQPGVALDLVGDYAQKGRQLVLQQVEGRGQTQRLHVVQHIHAGGAQVDDAAAQQALLGVGADLGHQVVTNLDLISAAAQVDLLLSRPDQPPARHIQPGLLLRSGQCDLSSAAAAACVALTDNAQQT